MTVPTYAAECPYCAQVRHVADQHDADAAFAEHVAAATPGRCAYWPDLVWRRLQGRHARRTARRRWVIEGGSEPDLGDCPHYRGVGICYQLGVCGNPDVMEPLCQTCEPADGWPSTRYIALGELDYQPVTLQRSITR